MRIVTFNIHGGRDGTEQRRLALDNITTTLAAASPDICLLQEVDRRLARSRFTDQARQLAHRLPPHPWHFAFYGRLDFGPIGGFGNAILAREPFAPNIRRLPLPSSGGEPRAAISIALGKRLVVWNTHLGLRDDWRVQQLTALADAVNTDIAAGYSVVVGGDFNARIDAPEVAMFIERTGLMVLSPDAPTFPASDPDHRIDFLFGTPELSVNATGVVAAPEASDHCLVWAEIVIPPSTSATQT